MPSLPPMLRRGRTWLIGVPAAILVLAVGGYVVIRLVEGPSKARLTLNDAVVATTTTGPTASTAGSGATTVAGATSSGGAVAGSWKVTSGSQAGYRVKETLSFVSNTAVGRTSNVSGTMTIAGSTVTAAKISVDMASVTSDRSGRDHQFQSRIMSIDQFPTATFSLTKPIDLGTLPADGTSRTYPATGDLTLRGVTRALTVFLSAERKSGAIVVNGTIPISFDDYAIPDVSGGPASVGRTGDLELVVVFAR